VYPIPTLRVLACTFETDDCTLSLSLVVATEHRGVSRHHEVISRSYGASEGSYRAYARDYRNSYSASLSQSHLQHSRSKIIGTCGIRRLLRRDRTSNSDLTIDVAIRAICSQFFVCLTSGRKSSTLATAYIQICLGAVSAQKSKITLFRQYQVRRLYIQSIYLLLLLLFLHKAQLSNLL